MPRIPDEYLESIVYLYPSVPEALAGRSTDRKRGGSGFLFAMPWVEFPSLSFVYIVTNRHVIDGGSTVVRLNTHDGGCDALDLTERDWVPHPAGDDISVCPIGGMNQGKFKFRTMKPNNLLTKEFIDEYAVGPGDEIFVIGRFVNREGVRKNIPTARFGHIAQMHGEPIIDRRPTGDFEQESFIIEVKSIGGYSGSPVFLWIPPLEWRPYDKGGKEEWHIRLVGIDWCHINDWVRARDKSGKELEIEIVSNSGMMGVIPAWRLMEFFDMESERERRRKWEAKKIADRPPAATHDDAGADDHSATDVNPNAREDFMRLANAAARKQKPAE